MKIQYKAAGIMTLFGTVLVILLSWGYDMQSHRIVIDKELHNLGNISEEAALHIGSHLEEKSSIALTLSSAPLIKEALQKSNLEFSALADNKRTQEIDERNQRWMKTANINDFFIQSLMSNRVAEYLKFQQTLIPKMYGEIFLTNRYGVMIATTGKLTTLAHAHKYWWKASYNNGQGKIFLDDRGFDTSVKGYVLGIVIPIKDKSGIIGILKCNINILSPLTNIIQEFGQRHSGKMKIVRTGGLIVREQDITPLSTQVNNKMVSLLQQKTTDTTIIIDEQKKQLVAFSPIRITMESEKIAFGGRQKSIDHLKGNEGESWHVVVSLDEEQAIETAHETTRIIIVAGTIFTVLTAAVALLLGKLAARPIVKLALTAKTIGEGNLTARARIHSKDEIGSLAKSLNKMTENLQKTMTSRDELVKEVNWRIKLEEKLQFFATIDELTGAYNRRAFNDYMRKNISRAKRYNEPLSLLLIDIDFFKKINDVYGHDAGDLALSALVRIVMENNRKEDAVARWGGEEFTVSMPQTGKDAALVLAERLRKKISRHEFPKVGHVTVSAGLTELHADDTVDSLVKRADDALYEAKNGGRNRVVSY